MLQKWDFFPSSFFLSSWPLHASPKIFGFSWRHRDSLCKQSRGRFPIIRKMKNHIFADRSKPRFTANLGLIFFEQLCCHQQEQKHLNSSTAQRPHSYFHAAFHWGAPLPLSPQMQMILPSPPCWQILQPSEGQRAAAADIQLHTGAGPSVYILNTYIYIWNYIDKCTHTPPSCMNLQKRDKTHVRKGRNCIWAPGETAGVWSLTQLPPGVSWSLANPPAEPKPSGCWPQPAVWLGLTSQTILIGNEYQARQLWICCFELVYVASFKEKRLKKSKKKKNIYKMKTI